jgi:hypothetical protein
VDELLRSGCAQVVYFGGPIQALKGTVFWADIVDVLANRFRAGRTACRGAASLVKAL